MLDIVDNDDVCGVGGVCGGVGGGSGGSCNDDGDGHDASSDDDEITMMLNMFIFQTLLIHVRIPSLQCQ